MHNGQKLVLRLYEIYSIRICTIYEDYTKHATTT